MAYAQDSEADMTPATSEESVAVPDASRRLKGRHPSYNVMVKRAIAALKNKRGASAKSISHYIVAHFSVKRGPCKTAVTRCLKRMVKGGYILKNKRNLYKLTGKGRKMKGRRRRGGRRRSLKKGGRRRRRRRGRKGRKGRKGRRRRRRRRGRKGRKGRGRRRRRRGGKRRKGASKKGRGRRGRRGGRRRRRRRH